MTKSILLKGTMVFVLSFLSFLTFAQQKIGTNPGALNPGAILELESSNKGFLPPRVALSSTTTWGLSGSASASAIFGGQTAAADGMMVYNTATAGTAPNNVTPGFYIWTGGAAGSWKRLNTVAAVTNANGLALDANGVLSYTPSTNSIPATAITGANVTAGSNRVTLGGTPTGAALSPFSVDINEANLNLANVGGTLPLSKLSAGTAGQALVMVGTTPTWVTPSASTAQNIYTTDGTLTGNRSIFMGSNTMAFDTTTFFINPTTNRVGINTTTPGSVFNVRTSQSVVSGSGNGDGITISSGSAGRVAQLRTGNVAAGESIFNGGTLELQTSGSVTNVILRSVGVSYINGGNVGIGTTTPSQPLHVVGNTLISGLGGTGSRMVVADANGLLSTQAIPTGTVTGAANGLSLVSGNAELGGTLTKPTTITTSATNLLSIAGLQAKTVQNDTNDSLVVVTGSGALTYRSVASVSPIASVTSGNGLTLTSGVLAFSPVANSIPATAITGANVTAGSNRVTLGGTPTGAALSPFSVDINEANLNLANVGGTLPLTKLQAGTAGQELVMVGTTPTWVTPSASTTQNIYTTNGTLTGNRSIFMGSNTMAFDTTTFFINPTTNRIGIGTTTPVRTLDVVGSLQMTSSYPSTFDNPFGTLIDFLVRTNYDGTGNIGHRFTRGMTSGDSWLDIEVDGNGHTILDAKDNSKNLSITAANVGIGTTNPTQKLHVSGNALISGLGGTGSRMVVADANGLLSTQAIPTGTVTGATNGLSLVSGNAELGGALTKPTTITTSATNLLRIAGLQAKTVQNDTNDSLMVVTGSGALTYRSVASVSPISSVTSGNGLTLTSGVLAFNPVANSIPATTITGANVTAGSNKVTLGGTPTGAALSPFSVDVNEANLNLANVGGTLPLSKLSAGTAGQELVMVGTTPTWVTPSASTTQNIYTTDGTLTGNRTVNLNNNILSFNLGSGSINLDRGHANTNTRIGVFADTLEIQSGGNPYQLALMSTGNISIGSELSANLRPNPTSRIDLNGSVAFNIRRVAAATTLDITDRTVLANAFTSGFTITLPAPSTCIGREYIIRKTDESSNAITFTFAGITGTNAIRVSDTSATAGSYINTLNYVKTLRIQSDGIDWYLVD